MNRSASRGIPARPGESEEGSGSLLALYARYTELIRDQEEALDLENLERFEELARAREAVQEEVEAVFQDPGRGAGSSHGAEEDLEALYDTLKEAVRRDRRLRERLQTMKRSASKSMDQVEGRGKGAKGYLARDAAAARDGSSRLNVRL
jgi:methylmalonyl-CoA mutase N-terminal domain/subunit